jgi:hypothetical protein
VSPAITRNLEFYHTVQTLPTPHLRRKLEISKGKEKDKIKLTKWWPQFTHQKSYYLMWQGEESRVWTLNLSLYWHKKPNSLAQSPWEDDTHVVTKFNAFMELSGSLPCSKPGILVQQYRPTLVFVTSWIRIATETSDILSSTTQTARQGLYHGKTPPLPILYIPLLISHLASQHSMSDTEGTMQ